MITKNHKWILCLAIMALFSAPAVCGDQIVVAENFDMYTTGGAYFGMFLYTSSNSCDLLVGGNYYSFTWQNGKYVDANGNTLELEYQYSMVHPEYPWQIINFYNWVIKDSNGVTLASGWMHTF